MSVADKLRQYVQQGFEVGVSESAQLVNFRAALGFAGQYPAITDTDREWHRKTVERAQENMKRDAQGHPPAPSKT